MSSKNIKRYIRIPIELNREIDIRYKLKGYKFKGDYIVNLISNGIVKEEEDYKIMDSNNKLNSNINELNNNIIKLINMLIKN